MKTLVFVFPQEDREIKGLASFLSALISSAMESTVREARIQTTESGGVVCELPVYVETFNLVPDKPESIIPVAVAVFD